MWTPSQSAGALLWSVIISLRWVHAQFLQPAADWFLEVVLGAWEESIRSVIREAFSVITHTVNSASGAVLSIFSGSSYFQTVRRTSGREAKSGAWASYWEQASGTFNALLEREGLSSITLPALSRAPSSTPPEAEPCHGSHQQQQQQEEEAAPSPRHALPARLRSWWQRRRGAGAQDLPGQEPPVSRGSRAAVARNSQGQPADGQKDRKKEKRSKAAGGVAAAKKEVAPPMRGRDLSRGSMLFELPSGFAISEGEQRRGLVEEARVAAEVGVSRAFAAVRRGVRWLLWLDGSNRLPSDLVASRLQSRLGQRQQQQQVQRGGSGRHGGGGGRALGTQDGQQAVEDLSVWTASDIILRAGYPIEEHSVVTPDGYVLQMHRIPRQGARDVVFFQHGVLDTSLGWVANGSQGSQAFAAFDAGFDVWLANNRSNAPRLQQDPKKRGSRYWHYSSNELGLVDIAAQIDHLHNIKMREILMQRGGGGGGGMREQASATGKEPTPSPEGPSSGDGGGPAAGAAPARLWRSASAPVLDLSWQDWDKGEGQEPFLDVAGAAPEPGATAPIAAPSGPEDEIQPALRLPSGDLLRRSSSNTPRGEQALRDREQQIGAAAVAEAVVGEPGEQWRAVDASLARPSSSAPAAGESAEGGQDAEGGQQVEAVQLEAAVIPEAAAASAEQHITAAEAEGGYSPLRRTQSAGAILAGEDWHSASHCRAGSRGAGRGGPGRKTARVHLEAGIAERGAQVPVEVLPLPTGGEGAHVGVPSPTAPLSPISTSKGGRQRSRSSSSSRAAFPTPGTPDSVEFLDWGSDMSSGGEGYATPHSAGYDTPRSGYATPRSDRSGTFSTGGCRGDVADVTPYRLQVVGHSLGAACVLMYAVGSRMMGKPHRVRRIVLMSPAGFHTHVPMALRPFKYLLPTLVRFLAAVRPGVGMGLRLPSPLLRYITFKLSMDLHHIPALHELVRAAMRVMLSGDRSQWDRAVQMPHYNTYSMPALSLHCGAHFGQWSRDPHFRLFDYGSKAANRQHYGSDVPPSIADHYHLLAPVPVDLIAGRYDGIIDCQDVMLHYVHMKEAGVHVSYREYDFGHMDFTFAVKDEMRHYVLSRLQRPIL